MEIQGLLFDLDGTLIHTQEANLEAYNFALMEFGLDISLENFKLTNGVDSRQFLEEYFPELTMAEINTIREIKASVYHKFFSKTYLNLVLANFIESAVGVKRLGIVTTGKKMNTIEILEYHKIRDKFDVIITGDDTLNPKPSPEPYLKAIENIKVHPSQILVFEDSQVGCESAIAAGLNVFRVQTVNQDEK